MQILKISSKASSAQSPKEGSPGKLAFTHEKSAEQCKKHNTNHEGEAFVGRPPIAVTHNPGNIRVQLLDEVETFSHSIDDFIDVLTVTQAGSQAITQELLDNGR